MLFEEDQRFARVAKAYESYLWKVDGYDVLMEAIKSDYLVGDYVRKIIDILHDLYRWENQRKNHE